MRKFWKIIVKIFTHNWCDTCGFTKSDLFITEIFMEGGLRQCEKCINKSNK